MLRSLFGVFFVLVAGAAAAQTGGPEQFGTDSEAITVIGFDDFLPKSSVDGWTGTSNSRSSPGLMVAGINMIPNGAVLESVVVYVHDVDPVEDVEVALCSSSWETFSGDGGIYDCTLAVGSTSGTPSSTVILLPNNVPILYQENAPGIGPTAKHFFLQVSAPAPLTRVHMARLNWIRQVSPAPLEASFGDVPTNHPFFQFVEALAASGITAGCGSGNYCPEAPLTRGQMAAFLAKALGLHWPFEGLVKGVVTATR
jgi:S-layer homology domain